MKVKLGLAFAMVCGLALAAGLVFYEGLDRVLGALGAVGWGFALMLGVHLVQMAATAIGWRCFIPGPRPQPVAELFVFRWIRDGVNGLLPVAQIGGEIVAARLLTFRGVRGDVAGASVVLDMTVEVATQLLFTLIGVLLLALDGRGGSTLANLVMGLLLAAVVFVAFIAAQRLGLFRLIERQLDRVIKHTGWTALDGMRGIDDAIQKLHGDARALLESAGWHFFAWLLGGVEVWVALYFMGVHIDAGEALIIESLGQAARSMAFAVPGGYGVQEGGIMLIGSMLGVPADAGLALALAKRLREIVLGAPSLAVWQYIEGRRRWRSRGLLQPKRPVT
jgi:putative membrane protein